jgi:hypothetical protein
MSVFFYFSKVIPLSWVGHVAQMGKREMRIGYWWGS